MNTDYTYKALAEQIILAVIVALVSASVTGCAAPREFDKIMESRWLDFSRHANTGFIITPHEYRGEYLGLATIRIICVPGGKEMGNRARADYVKANGELPTPVVPGYVIYLDEHDPDEIVDALVSLAKSIGADGIMDLRSFYDSSLYYSPYESVNNRTMVVSGFAFRKPQ